MAVVTLIDGNAVKTKKFQDPSYVGDPVNTVALLSSFEVEELILLDISASHQSKKTSSETLQQILQNAFMPIAYGGDIRSADDAKEYFELGFDKVVLRSSLFDNKLVEQISKQYGAQAVTGCLDVVYSETNPEWMSVNGNEFNTTDCDFIIERLSNLTVGEIVVQDVVRDGTREGLREHPLLVSAVRNLQVPVVALGGASNPMQGAEFVGMARCQAIAASSMFLFHPSRNSVLVNYPRVDDWHEMVRRNEV